MSGEQKQEKLDVPASSSREARGKRVQSLRKLTRQSRQQFEKKHHFGRGALQHWEAPRYGGLTEKGAVRLVAAFAQEGIQCDMKWLMHGIGGEPVLSPALFEGVAADEVEPDHTPGCIMVDEDRETGIIRESLANLAQYYPGLIHAEVSDDGCAPRYCLGEFVAGVAKKSNEINELDGQLCIVTGEQGQVWVRRLKTTEVPGYYHLHCSNPSTTVDEPVLYNVPVRQAAAIFWARKRFSSV